MKGKQFILIFSLLITIILAYGVLLNPSTKSVHTGRLQVVASFYPMYYFASQIGRDKADVFDITPPSTEPHDYEPTTQDIIKISGSDMLVLNGGKLEPWGDKIKSQLQGSKTLSITAGEGLANKTMKENGKTIQDPHIWLDPILAEKEIEVIEKGYERIDPADKDFFRQNMHALILKMEQLNTDFKSRLQSCVKKDFVTSHAAFGYLAQRYAIRQIAISGVSPDEEPSSQKLAEIADFIKKENITVIFFERLVNPKLSQTIAQETNVQTMVLDPIEGISNNDLTSGHDYSTIMEDNLSALQTALQCNK